MKNIIDNKKIYFILPILIFLIFTAGVFAKYLLKTDDNFLYDANAFYFESDLLEENIDMKQVQNKILDTDIIYVGGGNTEGNFETSTLDETTGTFCRLNVEGSNDGISIVDGVGNAQSVDTSDPALYNIMTRDYLFDNKDIQSSKQIETSSFAVIHRVPNVLYHKKNQIEDYIKKVERLKKQFSSNE